MTDKIDTSKGAVRKFGMLFGCLSVAVGAYMLYKGSKLWPWFGAVSVLFFGSGLFAKPVLKPVYVVWMKFASILGWINTRVLLGVFFYLVVTPTGLFMRLLGKDLLERKIDRSAKTYWLKREPAMFDPARYERLF